MSDAVVRRPIAIKGLGRNGLDSMLVARVLRQRISTCATNIECDPWCAASWKAAARGPPFLSHVRRAYETRPSKKMTDADRTHAVRSGNGGYKMSLPERTTFVRHPYGTRPPIAYDRQSSEKLRRKFNQYGCKETSPFEIEYKK